MTGRELIDYARPLPAATNAMVRGTRGGQPFSRYASLAELSRLQLGDQDTVTFITDSPARTVRVTVEGSRLGPSVLVTDRDAKLCGVLDHVAVDPVLADTGSVFLLRPSVAQQQRRAIDEALDRLERQLFLAVSATTGVAAIRAAARRSSSPPTSSAPAAPSRKGGWWCRARPAVRAGAAGGRRRHRHPRAVPTVLVSAR